MGDASGLSTPEKEEIAIKAKTEQLRIANYGKEADEELKAFRRQSLIKDASGLSTLEQDKIAMKAKKQQLQNTNYGKENNSKDADEELKALRSQSLTKKNTSKQEDASGLSTPEKEEIAIKAKMEPLRIA